MPELTATPDDVRIELSWQPVTAADSYEIRVYDSVTHWERLDDGALTSTSFPHTGLTTGRTYYYWVRARTAAGAQGPWSERIPAPALAAPALTATPASGQVTLTWQQVAGADSYEIQVWDSVDGWDQIDDGALTGTSFPHTGLTTGRTYHYWVRAVSAERRRGPMVRARRRYSLTGTARLRRLHLDTTQWGSPYRAFRQHTVYWNASALPDLKLSAQKSVLLAKDRKLNSPGLRIDEKTVDRGSS